MNTLFEYMYRDASNYKKFHVEVIKGKLSYADIEPYLHDWNFFIPSVIGLKDLQNLPFNEDDHIWHTIDQITIKDLNPTIDLTASQLIENFKNAYKNNWYESKVYYKLINGNFDHIYFISESDDICPNCGNTYYIWKNSSGEIQCDNCDYTETE